MMAAKLIYVTDEEFSILAKHLRMRDLGFDSLSLERKIIFMRDSFNEETKMPTKHIMTRAEAIACFKKHMPDAGRAEPVIDFYVAAGMLEIKEEEEKPIFELRYPSGTFAYKIWANGRVEGFNENIIVINRIPELIAKVKAK